MTLEMKLKEVSEEAFEDGLKQGVEGMVKLLKDLSYSTNDIIKNISKSLNISEEEVKNIYNTKG